MKVLGWEPYKHFEQPEAPNPVYPYAHVSQLFPITFGLQEQTPESTSQAAGESQSKSIHNNFLRTGQTANAIARARLATLGIGRRQIEISINRVIEKSAP